MDFAPWEQIVPDAKARAALVAGVLGSKPRSRPPVGRTPAADACTAAASDLPPSRLAGRELYIVYADASGSETERGITLRHLTAQADGRFLIHAFCHARRAPRAFRSDRVVECFDPDTGEELDFEALLHAMTHRAWHVDRADLEDFVRVLVFMAYCDGHLAPEEAGAIDDWISRFALRMDGTDEDAAQATRFARVAAIEGIDFLAALARLTAANNAAQLCRLTIQAVQDVIEADFDVTSEELGWHQVVLQTLRKVAML